MSEYASILRLDAAEQQARADGLEDLCRRLSVEANQLRIRVRDLEDAILLHREHQPNDPSPEDERLWAEVRRLWT